MNATPLLAIAAALLAAGCANTPTPNYDLRFGQAVREAKLKQTLNPAAGANPDQALGLDGRAAREGLVLYHDTFKKPPPVVNVINIGGAMGSAK
jgi:hypothetical protein